MKLYVIDKNNQKVYLNLTANSRKNLARQIGGMNFYLGNTLYSVKNVYAENDSNNSAAGAVIGGVVGALAGPLGILVGGLLGGVIGNGSDEQETSLVTNFNRS